MPKVKPYPQEERNRIIRACIAENIELYAMKKENIAKGLNISVQTLSKKMKDPDLFTIGEMQFIARYLKFTPVQAASVVLGRTITSKEVKEFILL